MTCVLSLACSLADNAIGAHYESGKGFVATPEVVTALAEAFTKMPQLTSVK